MTHQEVEKILCKLRVQGSGTREMQNMLRIISDSLFYYSTCQLKASDQDKINMLTDSIGSDMSILLDALINLRATLKEFESVTQRDPVKGFSHLDV